MTIVSKSVVVPCEPTEAMLDAANEISISCFEGDEECFVSNVEALSIYRAMVAAALPDEEPGEAERLRAEGFALAANQCRYGYGDEHGHHRCAEIDRLTREIFFAKTALVETQERLENERDAGFNHGYLMAVANIINLHRETVVAADVLLQIDLTIDDAEAFELAEYDMEALNRLRAEPRAADFFKSRTALGDAQEAGRSPDVPMWGRWFPHDEAPGGSYACLYRNGTKPVALAWMPAQGRPNMPDAIVMPFKMPKPDAQEAGR